MDKKTIEKSDWVASFNLIGEAKVNSGYTFKIDRRSEKSNWIYNAMNLGVWCGEKCGTVYSEMIGGYSGSNNNVIYAYGKKDDGSNDFENRLIINWEDRFDESVLEEVGEASFITVGLEKTIQGQTYYKKFLSAYDAIAYVKEHLTDGMVLNIHGSLRYSSFNGNTQVKKDISSIVLSRADDRSKYAARFTQSILIDKDSASFKNIDKNKSVMYVNAKVLDYVREINGIEVKGQYPYDKQFEFPFDLTNQDLCKAIYEKLFKVKKGVTQITFEGDFVEGGAVATATWDDVTEDIKDLVALGLYTEEQALALHAVSSGRERRMVLRRPSTRKVTRGDIVVPVLQKFENKYTEEDLILDYLYNDESDENLPFDVEESSSSDDSMDWLNNL